MLTGCNVLILIFLFLIAMMDIRERRIPNAMLLLLLVCVIFGRVVSEQPISLLSMIVGSFSVAFFLLFLSWIRPGCFGLGDVKLMLVMGMHVGFYDIWYAFAMAVICAAIFCIIGLCIKRLTLKSEIPFGPFLCMGIVIMILCRL